ncbi:glutathione S-transferase [Astrocystis sublimbata]|nr:glutathione S-transferase [Astrocystis sublimbata]
MALIVHHLGVSQSDRVVWLCEELGIEYELKTYKRSPLLAPPEYKALHPLGAAPVIEDGDLKIAESSACLEYIAQIHGKGRFVLAPGNKDYAQFLYWFHFANASFTSSLMRNRMGETLLGSGDDAKGAGMLKPFKVKFQAMLDMINKRLAEVPWLAGEEFTIADIMLGCCFTTLRCFAPFDLGNYEHILEYLKRISDRDGYRQARLKGDPELDTAALASAVGPTGSLLM